MAGTKLPTQADVESYFKRLNNWGRWGHDDQRGTVNLIDDARRAAAPALSSMRRPRPARRGRGLAAPANSPVHSRKSSI